jgi:hypothetical protein
MAFRFRFDTVKGYLFAGTRENVRTPGTPNGSAADRRRIYQLGMTVQVRDAVEKSNERAYGQKRVLRFYDVLPVSKEEERIAVSN